MQINKDPNREFLNQIKILNNKQLIITYKKYKQIKLIGYIVPIAVFILTYLRLINLFLGLFLLIFSAYAMIYTSKKMNRLFGEEFTKRKIKA